MVGTPSQTRLENVKSATIHCHLCMARRLVSSATKTTYTHPLYGCVQDYQVTAFGVSECRQNYNSFRIELVSAPTTAPPGPTWVVTATLSLMPPNERAESGTRSACVRRAAGGEQRTKKGREKKGELLTRLSPFFTHLSHS